jgi:glycosyltransferase involved in cell wall biosynthesis
MNSCVIPAYNEQDRIEACIVEARNVFDEIMVVVDGSDSTYEIVQKWMNEDSRVKMFYSPFRLGKGGAFFAGVGCSRGERVFMVDADFPVPSRYVGLFDELLDQADVVVGSRFSRESRLHGFSSFHRIFSLSFAGLCRGLFNVKLDDFQCGFKAFRRTALKAVMPYMRSKHRMTGKAGSLFDVELLVKLARRGFRIAQVPVEYWHDGSGKVTAKQLVYSTLNLWSLIQNQ